MATNYKLLSEQIRRAYSRGIDREDTSPRLDDREIKLYVVQAINMLIKAEIANIGENVDSVLGTYELERDGTSPLFYVTLPVIPISLPKNMGIWRVYQSGCPWNPYIPLKHGDFDIAQGTPAQYLETYVGYYQDGKRVYFTKEPSATVTLKLVVNDPAKITDTEVLPIPPEMESMVIDEVIRRLSSGQASQYELNGRQEQSIITPKQIDG
jgi:hypothetical protein